MLRKFAFTGDVSESTWCAEEWRGDDPIEEGFGVGAIRVDIRRRFDTVESCVVGVKLLPDLSCTCE